MFRYPKLPGPQSISLMVAALAGAAACGDPKPATECGEAVCPDAPGTPDAAVDAPAGPPDANPNMPATLAESGLCANPSCSQINPGIIAFKPRWELYSDTATKKRWLYLPPGTKIDTTEMDYWKFPVGTKLWKEFTRDNIRVETRLMIKTGPMDDEWYFISFEWNATQDATVAAEIGKQNANGTMHDIPSRAQCGQCHNRVTSRVLGFGALQLDYNNNTAGEMDLADAISANILTAPPTSGNPQTRFALPGNQLDKDALGYLHANCGHCHNPKSDVHDARPVELRLEVGKLGSVRTTTTGLTAIDIDGGTVGNVSKIITPGDITGANSTMILRMEATNFLKMPAFGTETKDMPAIMMIKDWIRSL